MAMPALGAELVRGNTCNLHAQQDRWFRARRPVYAGLSCASFDKGSKKNSLSTAQPSPQHPDVHTNVVPAPGISAAMLQPAPIRLCTHEGLLSLHLQQRPALPCRLCHADDPDHRLVKCMQPCDKVYPNCLHPCAKLCFEECGRCMRTTEPFALPCGHTSRNAPCWRCEGLVHTGKSRDCPT